MIQQKDFPFGQTLKRDVVTCLNLLLSLSHLKPNLTGIPVKDEGEKNQNQNLKSI